MTISRELKCASLGQTWLNLVALTLHNGTPLGDEGLEMLAVTTSFPIDSGPDAILARFGDAQMMAEMSTVFFSDAPNRLGHSYAGLMRGPNGRQDLEDVISLLRAQPLSKRAVVTLCGNVDGEVPCINAIQFLIREGVLQVIYFARGQDAFKKFYADGLCMAKMAQTVARRLDLATGWVTGFLGSSHIYHSDVPAIEELLANTRKYVSAGELQGFI
jgi:thymidylate synthase